MIIVSVKTKKSRVSWKMFEMGFKFSKLLKIIVLDVSEPTKRLDVQSTAYALRNWKDKEAFVKENVKIK